MKWIRESKTELAGKIERLVGLGMDSRQIAQRLGKTRRRVQQVAKLFSLQLKRSSG